MNLKTKLQSTNKHLKLIFDNFPNQSYFQIVKLSDLFTLASWPYFKLNISPWDLAFVGFAHLDSCQYQESIQT